MPASAKSPAAAPRRDPARAELEQFEAFRKRESVRTGVGRIAGLLTRQTLRHIEHPESPEDRTDDIHQVRVQCKRLRALLRLVKPATDAHAIARENARVRDAARTLSDYRDAFVAGETLKRVFDDTAQSRVLDAAVLLGIKHGVTKHKVDLKTAFAICARELREMLACVRVLDFKSRGWDALAPGLERSYRRARAAFHKCHQRQDKQFAEIFHDWRKRVKDLAYQLEFLENVEPGVVKRMRKEFRRLGTLLGEDHDYVVFAEHVREREKHYEHLATFQPVRKRLKARLRELRAHEFALAQPLFSDLPEVWISRMAGYWRRWKNPALAAAEIPAPPPAPPAAGAVPDLTIEPGAAAGEPDGGRSVPPAKSKSTKPPARRAG